MIFLSFGHFVTAVTAVAKTEVLARPLGRLPLRFWDIGVFEENGRQVFYLWSSSKTTMRAGFL